MKKSIKNRDGLENNDDWATPDWLLADIQKRFKIDYDPCPLNYTVDGLDRSIPWGRRNYINPPYNRIDKPAFIARAYEEWKMNNNICVMLLPASTDTLDFHEMILPHAGFCAYDDYMNDKVVRDFMNYKYDKIVLFFKGRISFKGVTTKGEYTESKKGKHGSMLVIFKH